MAASYKKGVEWIAINDEPAETDATVLAGLISVQLLADLFNKQPEQVVLAILRKRRALEAVGFFKTKGGINHGK